jgi:hypothetical protein
MPRRHSGPLRASEVPQRDRKVRDRAVVLPLIGAILLLPPIAGIFRLDGTVGGVPATLLCVFVVWALLIAGAAANARRLRDKLDAPTASGGQKDGA